MRCRACNGALKLVLDLGHTPLANSYSDTAEQARNLEKYPLRLCSCMECSFVQLDVAIPSEVLFSSYAYETPRVKTLEQHYRLLIGEIAKVLVPLPGRSVLEMGSNNGAFLETIRPFVGSVRGIEPSQIEAKVPTDRIFFTKENAAHYSGYGYDLFVARHCMAHLDDLRGTLEGVHTVLAKDGWAVIENAYLLDTLVGGQFDQIYHEHMSYFALRPMLRLFESVGLHLRHVYHSTVHGGSIAMFVSKQPGPRTDELERMLAAEAGLEGALGAFSFQAQACIAGLRAGLRMFAYQTVDSYGATAKGNTLLNVLGPETVKIRYAVDSTPSKQGRFLPGTGIKVISEEEADGLRPDAYLLTAWNYAKEILENQDEYRRAGGHFILPFPYPRLV